MTTANIHNVQRFIRPKGVNDGKLQCKHNQQLMKWELAFRQDGDRVPNSRQKQKTHLTLKQLVFV